MHDAAIGASGIYPMHMKALFLCRKRLRIQPFSHLFEMHRKKAIEIKAVHNALADCKKLFPFDLS
jgi:hypothetical protein